MAWLRLDRPVATALDVETGAELVLERHDDDSVSVALPTVVMHRLVELRHD